MLSEVLEKKSQKWIITGVEQGRFSEKHDILIRQLDINFGLSDSVRDSIRKMNDVQLLDAALDTVIISKVKEETLAVLFPEMGLGNLSEKHDLLIKKFELNIILSDGEKNQIRNVVDPKLMDKALNDVVSGKSKDEIIDELGHSVEKEMHRKFEAMLDKMTQDWLASGIEHGKLIEKHDILIRQLDKKFFLNDDEKKLIRNVVDPRIMDKALEAVVTSNRKDEIMKEMEPPIDSGVMKMLAEVLEEMSQKWFNTGQLQEDRTIARKMKNSGVSMDIIIHCSGLSEEEINKL